MSGEAKIFLLKGGEAQLAISKDKKKEAIAQYKEWADRSKALIITEYTGVTMKDLDRLRSKVREAGGEFHIIKNTLGKLALEESGFSEPEQYLQGSTAIAFAFEDGPSMAKVLTEFAKTSEFLKFKGGYLDQEPISAAMVKELADLPSLPVLRAMLLGVIMAPASKLVRTLAEPGRMIAAVVKAYSDSDANATAA